MIELSEIKKQIQQTNLETARQTFALGEKITASGKIIKTTVKNTDLIAVIKSEMKIFASMANVDLVAFNPKFKKGETIKIEGVLQSLGFDAVCLQSCRIINK